MKSKPLSSVVEALIFPPTGPGTPTGTKAGPLVLAPPPKELESADATLSFSAYRISVITHSSRPLQFPHIQAKFGIRAIAAFSILVETTLNKVESTYKTLVRSLSQLGLADHFTHSISLLNLPATWRYIAEALKGFGLLVC
jgi:hypothetical protein